MSPFEHSKSFSKENLFELDSRKLAVTVCCSSVSFPQLQNSRTPELAKLELERVKFSWFQLSATLLWTSCKR